MQVTTKRFGTIEVDEGRVVTFPRGLIGFADFKRFVSISIAGVDESLKWLQSVDDPTLGFVTLDPKAVFPGYDPEFCITDLSGLGDSSPGDLVMLSIITIPQEVEQMTANLQAPLVINPAKRLGKQVIVQSSQYTTKHTVFAALQSFMKRTG